MRHLVASAVLLMTGITAFGRDPANGAVVLLDFRDEFSAKAVEAMQSELTKLMKPAGLVFSYRLGSELGPDASPTDIIVVRFNGACRRDVLPPVFDERGAFAYTHVSNGEILPFAEVACDRVHSSVKSLTGKLIAKVSDELLGRALARVVAHELYHIVTRTAHHGSEGVAARGLTSSDLVARNLSFAESDLRKFTKH
jgi:hypothetical protein